MKKKTGVLVPLSPQNLVDCSTSDGNHGCRGGYISKAYNYMIRNRGVDSERFYPYEHQVISVFKLPPGTPAMQHFVQLIFLFVGRELSLLCQRKSRPLHRLPHPSTRWWEDASSCRGVGGTGRGGRERRAAVVPSLPRRWGWSVWSGSSVHLTIPAVTRTELGHTLDRSPVNSKILILSSVKAERQVYVVCFI